MQLDCFFLKKTPYFQVEVQSQVKGSTFATTEINESTTVSFSFSSGSMISRESNLLSSFCLNLRVNFLKISERYHISCVFFCILLRVFVFKKDVLKFFTSLIQLPFQGTHLQIKARILYVLKLIMGILFPVSIKNCICSSLFTSKFHSYIPLWRLGHLSKHEFYLFTFYCLWIFFQK